MLNRLIIINKWYIFAIFKWMFIPKENMSSVQNPGWMMIIVIPPKKADYNPRTGNQKKTYGVNGDELSNRVTCIHSQLFIHFELPATQPRLLSSSPKKRSNSLQSSSAERNAWRKTKDIRPLRSNQTCLIDQDSSYCAYSM